MSVARCKHEVSRPEFLQWRAYGRVHPFGEGRDDDRIAVAFATYLNAHIPRGKRRAKVDEFLVKYRPVVRATRNDKDIGRNLDAWLGVFKRQGRVVTDGGDNGSSPSS